MIQIFALLKASHELMGDENKEPSQFLIPVL